LFAPLCGCPATLCLCRAVNEDMKRAATYAIAALAKRPIMKRRPSAGDLLRLADPQQGSVAAGAGAPSKDHSVDLAAATAAGTGTAANGDVADATGTGAEGRVCFATAAAQGNGTAAAAAAPDRAESTVSSSTLSTDTAATAGVSTSEVNSSAGQRHSSPSRQHSHHARSGSAGRAGHMRRKSYGESLQAFCEGWLRFFCWPGGAAN
jgi:hypothetical protein